MAGHCLASTFSRENNLGTQDELARFLAEVERRAYRRVLYSVRDNDAALDIVQDAMMKLAEKYGDRPAEEFPMLFQRIIQNTIRDYYRRSKVRSLWTTLLSAFSSDDEEEHDPLETIEVESESYTPNSPDGQLEQSQLLVILEEEIKSLPPRQREAFLMRYWEDMDVAETASAMGCSEGSVKTHCSRATHTLANALKARGITL